MATEKKGRGPFSMTEQFEATQESDALQAVKGPSETAPVAESLPEDPELCYHTDVKAPAVDPIGEALEAHHATPKPGDSQWKDNNPKAAFGAAKVGIDYLSFPVLLEQAIGMMAGGYKYGAHNYLVAAPSVMTYVAACFRHIAAFVGGEEFDPHAGEGVKVHHLVAAQNCLHVVRAAMINGTFFDDRPPQMPAGFIESLSESVLALQRNNPDPVARYLANGKRGPGRIL